MLCKGRGQEGKPGHAYKIRTDALKINHICGVAPKLRRRRRKLLQSYWGQTQFNSIDPRLPWRPIFPSLSIPPSSPAISWYISIPHPSSYLLLSLPHCTWHRLFPWDYWVTYCRAKHRNSTLWHTQWFAKVHTTFVLKLTSIKQTS